MTLRTLNYGNHGIFFIMGNAGFISSTVLLALTSTGTRTVLVVWIAFDNKPWHEIIES